MTNLINGVPARILDFLKQEGWRYHDDIKAWRKHCDDGSLYSPHAHDHDQAFPGALQRAAEHADVAEAQAELEAEKAKVYGNAGSGIDSAAFVQPPVPADGEVLKSSQVSQHDAMLAANNATAGTAQPALEALNAQPASPPAPGADDDGTAGIAG